MEKALKDMGVSSKTEQRQFLNDVFGYTEDDVYVKGLCDAEDEDDFRATLDSFRPIWRDREAQILNSESPQEKVFAWVSARTEMMCSTMIRDKRRNAGLGDPPKKAYSNMSEAVNHVLSVRCPSPQPAISFIDALKEEVKSQEDEAVRALYGRGEYELCQDYKYLEITEEEWFRARPEDREQYVRDVRNLSMEDLLAGKKVTLRKRSEFEDKDTTWRNMPNEAAYDWRHDGGDGRKSVLTVSENNSGLHTRLSQSHVAALWKKAAMLKSSPSAICVEPTLGINKSTKRSFMVASFTGGATHRVEVTQKRNIICDCAGFSSEKICSHVLAISDTQGLLPEFLDKFCGKTLSSANLGTLANAGVDRDKSGKKGQRNSTRRRMTLADIAYEVSPPHLDINKTKLYSKVWHNDNPFEVVFLSGNIRKCTSCGIQFPKSHRPAPYDVVLRHSERYEYPDRDNPGATKVSYKEKNAYYHVDPECVISRHPHFKSSLISVSNETKKKLKKVHTDYLNLHFNMDID